MILVEVGGYFSKDAPARQAPSFAQSLAPSPISALQCVELLRPFRHVAPVSRVKKIVSKLLEGRSDANVGFDDLCLVLERAGFTRRSGKGSHTIFTKDGVTEILNLQPKGGKAKP